MYSRLWPTRPGEGYSICCEYMAYCVLERLPPILTTLRVLVFRGTFAFFASAVLWYREKRERLKFMR